MSDTKMMLLPVQLSNRTTTKMVVRDKRVHSLVTWRKGMTAQILEAKLILRINN